MSDQAGGEPIRRLFFWFGYWVIGFGVWLLFVDTVRVHELWMAVLASGIAATACEIVRALPFARFRPKIGWLLQAWREPWYIIEGCASIFWVFVRQFFNPEPSVLREIAFDPGGSDPQSAARRALAILYTTMPPNFAVLGIDLEKRVMVFHQVTETKIPTVARNLGAKS